ncbi:MAG: hypothetical protein HZC28_14435 [Spirochaetes bacterium]|nr:hypothetical protein [Spirochaetota bacterium]
MATVVKEKATEAQKAEFNDRIKEFREQVEAISEKIKTLEKEITAVTDKTEAAYQRIKLSELYMNVVSYHCGMSQLSQHMLNYKNESYLNEGRKILYKVLILLEEALGNHIDDSLTENDDTHVKLAGKIDDKWRLSFARTLGYNINLLEDCYGDNTKWKWSFVEVEGRYAIAMKNFIDYKNYIKNLDPRVEGFAERSNMMKLVKKLLLEAAESFRKKYELKEHRLDDMKYALNILGAMRRIHMYLGEADEANERKKVYDLWKKKMEDDLRKKEELDSRR